MGSHFGKKKLFLIFSAVVGTDVKSANLGLILLEKNRASMRLF